MPARKKRRSSPAALDMSVFGNPKTRTRAVVAQTPTKNKRQQMTRSAQRGAAVASGQQQFAARPAGSNWHRTEQIIRTPVVDSVVRTPVTDTTIVVHRGMNLPKSAMEYAKAGAAVGGGAVLAGKIVGGALKAGKRIGKFALRKTPGVGTLLTGASVGRTVYKIAKTARSEKKLNKAAAIRALITSAL